MNWNHRVVRVKDATTNETLYMLAEVFYNDDGTPAGYTSPFMLGESKIELLQLVDHMAAAIERPVLNAEDMKYVEQELDDDDNEKTRADVIRELAESVGVTVRDVPMPNPGECPLCGNPETCKECK